MNSKKHSSRQDNYKLFAERRMWNYTAFLYYSSWSKLETVKRYWLIYASYLFDKILKIIKIRMILEEHTQSQNETFQEKCVIWMKLSEIDFFFNFDNVFDINPVIMYYRCPAEVFPRKNTQEGISTWKRSDCFESALFLQFYRCHLIKNSIFSNENFVIHSQTEIKSFIKNNCN